MILWNLIVIHFSFYKVTEKVWLLMMEITKPLIQYDLICSHKIIKGLLILLLSKVF